VNPVSSSTVGILGGTFDPPHLGHLILAETARDALNLEQVVFVPAANPPHKGNGDVQVTPIEHRWQMVVAATANNPHFRLSTADMLRPGPHYTVDMLRIVQAEYPGAQLYFLLGGDSLRDLATWRDPAGIVAQARLAVMRRPGAVIDLTEMERQIPGISARVHFVDAPVIGISATAIRERVRAGQSIRYLVPADVERYIGEHGLYGRATVASPPA